MTYPTSTRRTLPPDARIIHPHQQPQRYDGRLIQAARPLPPVRATSAGSTMGQTFRELVETILPAVLIALLIHLFLAQATRVEGYSMEPTLYGHQRLVIEKVSYRFHSPERGDIVVVRAPGYGSEMLIKRVIGLPGDTIRVADGEVFVNEEPLQESYLKGATRGQYYLQKVPEDSIFVMGDNRNNSNDSRAFGPVPIEDIVGRAWVRYWPLTDLGLVE